MSSTEIIQLRSMLATRLKAHRNITQHVRTLTAFVRSKGINTMIETPDGLVSSAQVYAKARQAYLVSLRQLSPVRRKIFKLEGRRAPPLQNYLDSLVPAPRTQPTLLLSYRSKEM